MKTALAKFKPKHLHRLHEAVQLALQLRIKRALRSVRIFHSKRESYPWTKDGIDESEILG